VKNITVSVDDEVYHQARVEAARRRTSVSAVVRRVLVELATGRDVAGNEGKEFEQRQRLVDLLEECNLGLTERPTREATYAGRRFH
jgi:hypothetical protein